MPFPDNLKPRGRVNIPPRDLRLAEDYLKSRVKNLAKNYGLGISVPRAYAREATRPVDPRKVIFLEATHEQLPEAFEVMYARLESDPDFDVQFVSLGKNRVSAARYLKNCEAFAREVATAHLVFLCDASDVISALPLRPQTKVVQLWHACGAFKKWGMSTAELQFGLDRADTLRHPGYENLTLVTVSSPEVEWAYVEAMDLAGREHIVRPLGVSRTDVLFDERFYERAFRHVYEAVPQAAGKRIVLYAPTFRGSMAHAEAPQHLQLDELRRELADTCVLLVKHHPAIKARPAIPATCEGFAVDVTDSLPIDELLVVSDVLVTDYSSVVFEFSLFGRPLAFFAPDREEYLVDRSFYYDYEDFAPGPIFTESAELAEFLKHPEAGFDREKVEAFRRKFMRSCDGASTERILSAVLGS